MSWLPTPYTIQHIPHTGSGTDAHGNPVDTYGTPVDVAVHGWAPPTADQEPFEAGRSAVVRDLDVYLPDGSMFRPKDRASVAGVLYEVVGHPEDYTTGPFRWAAGWRLNLKRVEG